MNVNMRISVRASRIMKFFGAVVFAAAVGAGSALVPTALPSQSASFEGDECPNKTCDTKYKVCVTTDLRTKCTESSAEQLSFEGDDDLPNCRSVWCDSEEQ